MVAKLLVGIAFTLVSVSCAAQVAPAVNQKPPLGTSLGVAMNYWSADWGAGKINRWGPSASGTITIWHDWSVIAEGRALIWGGNSNASGGTVRPTSAFKYYSGAGGVLFASGYWGRFQPLLKAEAGYASMSHPSNLSGHFHDTSTIYTLGGGFDYHTHGNLWTRFEYNYDFFPNFQSYFDHKNHGLNPRGITFGMTYRFGPWGSRF